MRNCNAEEYVIEKSDDAIGQNVLFSIIKRFHLPVIDRHII